MKCFKITKKIQILKVSKKERALLLSLNKSFCLNNRENPEKLDRESQRVRLIEKLPEKIQNYLKLGRYDRPVGYLLLFWPCSWGLTLGAPLFNYEFFKILTLFFSGSVLMRASGCIINDIWDREIDSKVIRSRDRPLACGKINIKQAGVFLSGHLLLSLCILLQLPKYSIIAGLGIIPIVCIYPYMKRVTYFPQLFLGLAFNSGIFVGIPSITGLLNLPVLIPLYTAGILWTLIYDTIYAHMDKIDDREINVKSTALYFGEQTKLFLLFFAFLMTGLFTLSLKTASKNNKINYTSGLFLFFSSAFQLFSIYKVNLDCPKSCLKHFKLNSYFGLLIFFACITNGK
jgi:4-hydroxybenzoate polyprenyltransferase